MFFKKFFVLFLIFFKFISLIFCMNEDFRSYSFYLIDNLWQINSADDSNNKKKIAINLAFLLNFLDEYDVDKDELKYWLEKNIEINQYTYKKIEYLLNLLKEVNSQKFYDMIAEDKSAKNVKYPWNYETINKTKNLFEYMFQFINNKFEENHTKFFTDFMNDIWQRAQVATAGSSLKFASCISNLLDFCKYYSLNDKDLEKWIINIDIYDNENLLKINSLNGYLDFSSKEDDFKDFMQDNLYISENFPWDDKTRNRANYIFKYIKNYLMEVQKEKNINYIQDIEEQSRDLEEDF